MLYFLLTATVGSPSHYSEQVFIDALKNFIPLNSIEQIDIEDYKKYYNHLTEREIEEAEKSFQLVNE